MYINVINYYELNQGETYLEKPYLFDPTCRSLIHWANGKFGAMADLNNDNVMRFVSYHYEPGTENSDDDMRKIPLTKEDELTSPIVAEGIVVYWLKEYHGKLSTAQIFNSYYDKKEKEYIQQNEKALDGWKRNFKMEFWEKHLQQVQQQVIISENIYPFLKEEDVSKIKELEANYLEFVKSKKQTNSDNNNKELMQSESAKHINMEESVLNYISATDMRFYYEGWRNGKHGAICQRNGIYRFVEQARGKSGILDDVKRNEDDNPIVAIGIVAYWLQFNSRMDTVIKRLTRYRTEIPKDIKEQFENYTKERFKQFRAEHRDDPLTWEWDWEYEFYAKVIIPHEIAFNKRSEALFKYISDSDIALVKAVMKNYIKYLKKCRAEKGYRVSPELLVLRAVDSQDESKYEDLEDYEVKSILEQLKDEGYIDVMWIYGHKLPWEAKILDKGRTYLKQLEKRSGFVETKPSVHEITWEDEKMCFKSAVLHVMEQKKRDGGYLFEKPTQWKAIYRFAVDIGIMYDKDDPKEPQDKSTPQYAVFEKFAKELLLDNALVTRHPFTKSAINDINKENYARYNASYPWSQDKISDIRSLELYTKLEDVYLALQEEYSIIVSQAERSND